MWTISQACDDVNALVLFYTFAELLLFFRPHGPE